MGTGYLTVTDTKTLPNVPPAKICKDVTGWGVTRSNSHDPKDTWYHDANNNLLSTETTIKFGQHVFCNKFERPDLTDPVSVLVVFLIDPAGWTGSRLSLALEMDPMETHAEWFVYGTLDPYHFPGNTLNAAKVFNPPDTWYVPPPTPPPLLTPYRIRYNVVRYSWQP